MFRIPKVSSILEDSAAIWRYLQEQGGLDTKSYDRELEHDLRSYLSLPDTGSLDHLLRSRVIPVETFLFAFFRAIQPYAEMMSDLLRMFERACATQTNNNLAIRFDFGKELPELSFDLTHFRQWSEVWSSVAGWFLANVWNYDAIWALNGTVRTLQQRTVHPVVLEWLTQYYERRVWPGFRLEAPTSGVRELDERFQRAWRVWMMVVSESARYGEKRDDLRREVNRRNEGRECEERSESNRRLWTPEFLASIDSDHWAGSFAAGAYDHAERISQLPPEEQRSAADELAIALQSVFDQVRQEEVPGETLVRGLQDFLQLPIWKRRHELYSTWVGSRIIDACEDYGVKIHQVKGSLLFSFSGTHLATLTRAQPTLHIWAELRSPLRDPVGKGRKRSIQPDFSLVGDPITSPDVSILEVECKQYRKPSTKIFCNALTDYANGRPNAHVVLVNYGPVDESRLEGIEPSLRGRVSLLGQMRPGSDESQARFRQLVGSVLSACCATLGSLPTPDPLLPTGSHSKVTLTWGAVPRDLDLYVRIVSPEPTYEVYYSNRGSTTQAPWVLLDADITHGAGPETLEIARWIRGAKYHFAVHNFSNDGAIAGSGASVALTLEPQTWRFKCPQVGSGRWWSIVVLDSDTAEVQVINAIVDKPW